MGSYGKIGRLEDMPPDAELIACIRASADELTSGAKKARPKPVPKVEIPMPDEFAAALSGEARAVFEDFAPSAQRDYLEWVTEAKRDETRAKRIATAAEWIAEGKKRHWKYQDR